MSEGPLWVMDTSAFTHLCRAGHADLIERLCPRGVVVIPRPVELEIAVGGEGYSGIPQIRELDWVEVAVLTEDEDMTQLEVKAALAGGPEEHLGECALSPAPCIVDW